MLPFCQRCSSLNANPCIIAFDCVFVVLWQLTLPFSAQSPQRGGPRARTVVAGAKGVKALRSLKQKSHDLEDSVPALRSLARDASEDEFSLTQSPANRAAHLQRGSDLRDTDEAEQPQAVSSNDPPRGGILLRRRRMANLAK